ncbi:Ig-like domain-containing protein [Burkholderiaceae bacterium FT117]|uniref:Ig-like domain-containing protein n=1 Tax=Zeimonas sediminis TaxID=2944268 RepID=UPI002342CDE8|nr:Ig-like domain-containing protein [Zeimonas sediminis]MCM5571737.1 Ig-like domain-containing protein [Zeimonas sediminis]
MTAILEVVSAAGGIESLPLTDRAPALQAQPGARYRIALEADASLPVAPTVKRLGDDLVVEGLPEGRSLTLEGFFVRCPPDAPCSMSLENLGGTAADAITPTTRPVAAMADGSFLMYASGPLAAAVPAPPEAEASYKPALAGFAGLAVVGGGGGGSSGAADTTPPAAPTVDLAAFTNKARPVFGGSAEPGALVTLTVFSDATATWETRAGADGAWRVDTATDAPRLGQAFDLVEGIPVRYSVVAADDAGNRSALATGSLTLDTLALPAPVITSPLVTSDTTPTVRGVAEPGSRVRLTVDVDGDGGFEAAWETIAAGSGAWAIDLGSAPASGALPGGALAAGSIVALVAVASDGAGNTSPATTATLRVDPGLAPPPTIDPVAGDDAVNALEAGGSIAVTGTLPVADRPVLVSWGSATLAATVSGNRWSVVFDASQVPPDGTQPIRASYTTSAGVGSDEASRDVLVDRLAPEAPQIASVPDNDGGGINASEAADGATVRVDLAGTGAAAGDRVLVRAGDTLIAEHLISGAEIGGSVASVEISAAALAALGDGSFALSASVVDYSGNQGAASGPFALTIDTAPPVAALLSATIVDDRRPGTGTVEDGGQTNDRTPTLLLTLDSVLADGETLQVLRDSGDGPVLAGEASPLTDSVYEFTDSVDGRETYAYSARVVDAAGNATLLPLEYTIRVT